MAQRLDRDYPLWEYWFVEGLAQDRWALISKVHHCMVDGVSATDLYRVLFDATPEPAPPPPAEDRAIPAEPSGLELAARAVLDLARLPMREGTAIRRALADPDAALRQAGDALRGVARMAGALWPAPGSSLTGPIGRQRRYTWARASLGDVKMIKRELGGTVNDVVLAAISSGFRALLLARGEEPTPDMVPSLIPVSVRAQGEDASYDNQVSALVANLPVHIADPVEALAAIRAQLTELKESKESSAGQAVVSLGRLTPFPLASMFVRLAFSIPQREIVTVTTNVPGPQQPLYALGRELIEIIPYVPIATRLRTGVSIFTYNGKVTFGLTGDYSTTPDIAVLGRGIEDGLGALLAAAKGRRQEQNQGRRQEQKEPPGQSGAPRHPRRPHTGSDETSPRRHPALPA
jgi:diacylglycerol O-acyltransferase